MVSVNYCRFSTSRNRKSENDYEVDETEDGEDNFDEEELLTYYFYCGYSYEEILQFLKNYHNLTISYSTLLRRLQGYGLRRRNNRNSDEYQNSVGKARERIQALINGPGSLCGSYSAWWRNFFHDLEFRGILDMSLELHKECLWYCFSPLVQSDLDIVKAHWNTHSIRRSRHNTVAGRPDALFYLPELNRGIGNLLLDVPRRDIRYVAENIIEVNQRNEYTEYFDMVAVTANLSTPRTSQEALILYNTLLQAATG
eukprot:gene8892-9843_t